MDLSHQLPIVQPGKSDVSGDSAIDPVCGMQVDKSTAKHTHSHNGTTYYFCCQSCEKKFSADPERYLTGKSAEQHTHSRAQRKFHDLSAPTLVFIRTAVVPGSLETSRMTCAMLDSCLTKVVDYFRPLAVTLDLNSP